jgi:hypothetical protein
MKIAEVKDGQVATVTGQVRRAAELLPAELSGRPCVCQWTVAYTSADPERPSSKRWVTKSTVRDFLVEDETGAAIVWVEERHAYEDDTCVMFEIEGQIDWVEPGDTIGTHRERVIMEGDQVEVTGLCHVQTLLGGPYRGGADGPRLRIEAPDMPMRIVVLRRCGGNEGGPLPRPR